MIPAERSSTFLFFLPSPHPPPRVALWVFYSPYPLWLGEVFGRLRDFGGGEQGAWTEPDRGVEHKQTNRASKERPSGRISAGSCGRSAEGKRCSLSSTPDSRGAFNQALKNSCQVQFLYREHIRQGAHQAGTHQAAAHQAGAP